MDHFPELKHSSRKLTQEEVENPETIFFFKLIKSLPLVQTLPFAILGAEIIATNDVITEQQIKNTFKENSIPHIIFTNFIKYTHIINRLLFSHLNITCTILLKHMLKNGYIGFFNDCEKDVDFPFLKTLLDDCEYNSIFVKRTEEKNLIEQHFAAEQREEELEEEQEDSGHESDTSVPAMDLVNDPEWGL